MYLIGIDLGGTKCAVSLGSFNEGLPAIAHKCKPYPTKNYSPDAMLQLLAEDVAACIAMAGDELPAAIGISCGGPLDSRRGLILSPPNMPDWDKVPVKEYFEKRFSIPCRLCNDANAGALAEWKWGAGAGCDNMVFMTFGTGLGAGMILGGKLYEGASDMAGEVGHIRLAAYGPSGYGKAGSFEGFCSGGGIAQLAATMIRAERQAGKRVGFWAGGRLPEEVTAADVGKAAAEGDPLAEKILAECGSYLGQGLSLLIDILNPDRIVLGSIFMRCRQWLWPAAKQVIDIETLPETNRACTVLPGSLGESIGDYAALAVALCCAEEQWLL